MKKLIVSFLFLFISSSLIAQSKQEQIKALLDSLYRDTPESVGLMVHVEAPNYQVSYSYAVGVSDTINRTPIHADQPGGIASNTKTYTAATILRLIEEGKLTLYQAIGELLSAKTVQILQKDQYDVNQIQIYHLLSHTSGIEDYINDDYIQFVQENPKYRWTRDEQIARTVEKGDKLGEPGDIFQYGDINFILLTEIIEQVTQQPFYEAMSELLKYDDLNIENTWFYTLEEKPANTKESVVQYYSKYKVNSNDTDPSYDLYGAGGIWATVKDLAVFNYALFDERIITNPDVMELLYTPAKTKDNKDHRYYLGIQEYRLRESQLFGHGGFWGSIVYYLPDLDICVSIFVLEKDHRILRKKIGEGIVDIFLQESDQ